MKNKKKVTLDVVRYYTKRVVTTIEIDDDLDVENHKDLIQEYLQNNKEIKKSIHKKFCDEKFFVLDEENCEYSIEGAYGSLPNFDSWVIKSKEN